jgi:hypothetical protein
MKNRLSLVTVILGAALPLSQAEGPAKLNKDWMNLPSAPLRFDVAPKTEGYLVLGNYSTGRAVRYRLGCVNEQKGKITVLRQGSPRCTNLRSIDLKGDPTNQINYTVETLVLGITHGFTLERCEENAKLAVVEVEFEDGAIWKAKRQ